jgi:hypothetical protein
MSNDQCPISNSYVQHLKSFTNSKAVRSVLDIGHLDIGYSKIITLEIQYLYRNYFVKCESNSSIMSLLPTKKGVR